jgi:hypothetical protein
MRFFDENFVVTPGHSDCRRNTRLILPLSRERVNRIGREY